MVLAAELETVLCPGTEYDLDGLAKPRNAFLGRDAEGFEFGTIEAATGAPVDASAGEHVEQGDFLGEAQRMIERGERDGRTDAQPARPGRGQHRHQVHRGAHAERGEVVLREPHRVITALIHHLDALERAAVDRGQIDAAVWPAEEL